METDWKKKYEEALGIASRIKDDNTVATPQEVAEQIFPELAESEDEMIRKFLVRLCKRCSENSTDFMGDIKKADVLAWLEKQKEQKPKYCHHEVDLSDCSEEYRKAYYDGWNNCNLQHAQLAEEQKDSPMPEDTVIFQKGVAEGRRLERNDLPYWQTFRGFGALVPDDYILAKFGKGYKLLRPGDAIEIGTEFLQISQLDNLPKEESK